MEEKKVSSDINRYGGFKDHALKMNTDHAKNNQMA